MSSDEFVMNDVHAPISYFYFIVLYFLKYLSVYCPFLCILSKIYYNKNLQNYLTSMMTHLPSYFT